MADALRKEREVPKVSITESSLAMESIVGAAEGLTPDHRARLGAARCIFVPEEGRGNYRGPLFYGTTPELLQFLDEQGFPAELPVPDQDYKELALHADTTWLGLLLVNHEDALALVRLIAQWLNGRFAKQARRGHLDISIAVQNGESSKKVHYQGPVDDFEKTMRVAVESLNDVEPPRS